MLAAAGLVCPKKRRVLESDNQNRGVVNGRDRMGGEGERTLGLAAESLSLHFGQGAGQGPSSLTILVPEPHRHKYTGACIGRAATACARLRRWTSGSGVWWGSLAGRR